jgi:putative membrane protein
VDLIADKLDEAMSSVNDIQNNLNSTMNSITKPTAVVVGNLAGLCGRLGALDGLLDDAGDVTSALTQSTRKIEAILAEVENLRTLLNDYEPTLQETLNTVSSLSVLAAVTITDTVSLIDTAENLLRSTGTQLDAGTQQTLGSLASTLRKTANAMAATGDIQTSKDAMTGIIEELWNDHTGDVDNLLMMDATASAESLTDSRNGNPQSIQVLIRSQEIKVEEDETQEAAKQAAEKTTFWGRVAQMFKDFWAAITGIFH